jgi:propanol-preferring alcohol dehydrogenase
VNIPDTMLAMRIHAIGPVGNDSDPLVADSIPVPRPGRGELLLRVEVCGVCHTELDEIEGRTPPARLPMTPGHQVVGRVVALGRDCSAAWLNKAVGVAWIHSACGDCTLCREGRENLCSGFIACGRDAPGGYAEYMVAPEDFIYELPVGLPPAEAAPLLCAGAVGYRSLVLCQLKNGQPLGLTGFGASGHLVLQIARHLYPDSEIFVFARSKQEREFAASLGAAWTGNTRDIPPVGLQAVIDTTPAWLPVLCAMSVLRPGGRLVINAIRKEAGDRGELTQLDYDRHLWREKSLTTVTNVAREDVIQCLKLAAEIPLRPHVREFPLQQANEALHDLRKGHIRGANVLVIRD